MHLAPPIALYAQGRPKELSNRWNGPFRAEELAAPLIVLAGAGHAAVFERRGAWTIVDEHDLRVLGHPNASAGAALLCRLIAIEQQPEWLGQLPLTDLLARAPTAGVERQFSSSGQV
jgi:hypothetical protein